MLWQAQRIYASSFSLSGSSILQVFVAPGCRWLKMITTQAPGCRWLKMITKQVPGCRKDQDDYHKKHLGAIYSLCAAVCVSPLRAPRGGDLKSHILFSLCDVWGWGCAFHSTCFLFISTPVFLFLSTPVFLCCGAAYINNTSFSLSGSSILQVFIAPGCRWKGGTE